MVHSDLAARETSLWVIPLWSYLLWVIQQGKCLKVTRSKELTVLSCKAASSTAPRCKVTPVSIKATTRRYNLIKSRTWIQASHLQCMTLQNSSSQKCNRSLQLITRRPFALQFWQNGKTTAVFFLYLCARLRNMSSSPFKFLTAHASYYFNGLPLNIKCLKTVIRKGNSQCLLHTGSTVNKVTGSQPLDWVI